MIKPSGSDCNLNCTYCYYLHKKKLFNRQNATRMSDEILQSLVQQYIEGNQHDEIVFSWQGGEPTLMGIDFFEKAVSLQRKYNYAGKKIENTLQTNGILLNNEWASFLKHHNFLVGLSIDGPEEIHNIHRKDRNGKPSFNLVMEGLNHLKNHQVPFNVLATINRHNPKKPLEVYRFLTKEVGANYVQFNPCVEAVSYQNIAPNFWQESFMPRVGTPRSRPAHSGSVVTKWSVDPLDWGYFLCTVFDEWYKSDIGLILVNWFETAVVQSMKLPAQICLTGEICGKGVAIEYTGDVFSCDHYVYPEYCIGNIQDKKLVDLVFSEKQKAFVFYKRNSLPQYCLNCPHGFLCWGQCPRHRFLKCPEGEPGLNYLCPGFKTFYSTKKQEIKQIANLVSHHIYGAHTGYPHHIHGGHPSSPPTFMGGD